MMKQMGMKLDEINDIDTVILRGPNREVIIDGPVVTAINMQGQKMYQITGGSETERVPDTQSNLESIEILEEDILLVAQQSNVGLEKAKATLIQTKGDLAKAILFLKTS
jgi:nascent polypeptide-associated complex subunit alpha